MKIKGIILVAILTIIGLASFFAAPATATINRDAQGTPSIEINASPIYTLTPTNQLFASNFEHKIYQWKTDNGEWNVVKEGKESRYQTTSKSDKDRNITIAGDSWTDYTLFATMKVITDVEGSNNAGLVMRFQSDYSFLYFGYRGSKSYWEIGKEQLNTFDVIAHSNETDIKLNHDYQLKAVAIGDKLQLWVDGELQVETKESAPKDGMIGLMATNATVNFANVRVIEAPKPTATPEPSYTFGGSNSGSGKSSGSSFSTFTLTFFMMVFLFLFVAWFLGFILSRNPSTSRWNTFYKVWSAVTGLPISIFKSVWHTAPIIILGACGGCVLLQLFTAQLMVMFGASGSTLLQQFANIIIAGSGLGGTWALNGWFKSINNKLQLPAAAPQKFIPAINFFNLGSAYSRVWDEHRCEYVIYPHGVPVGLTPEMLQMHFLCIAPPGAGKTKNIIIPLITFCRLNNIGAIFLDPKGYDLPSDQFTLNFTTRRGYKSIRWCIIDLKLIPDPHQAAKRLGEALIPIPERGDSYWIGASRSAFNAIMSAYYLVHNRFPELADMRLMLADPRELETLDEALEKRLDAPRAREFSGELKTLLSRMGNPKNDTIGSLKNALSAIGGEFDELLTTNEDKGYSVSQIYVNGWRARFAFTASEGETGKMLARLLIQQTTTAFLSPDMPRDRLKLCVADEAHLYIDKPMAEGMAMSRGQNAAFIIATQSMEQFPLEVRGIVYTCAYTRLVMAGVGPFDAEYFSKDFGQRELRYTQTSNQTSNSVSNPALFSNSGSSVTEGSSSGTSSAKHLRHVWLPGEINRIPSFHAIYQSRILEDGDPVLFKFPHPSERPVMEPTLPLEERTTQGTATPNPPPSAAPVNIPVANPSAPPMNAPAPRAANPPTQPMNPPMPRAANPPTQPMNPPIPPGKPPEGSHLL